MAAPSGSASAGIWRHPNANAVYRPRQSQRSCPLYPFYVPLGCCLRNAQVQRARGKAQHCGGGRTLRKKHDLPNPATKKFPCASIRSSFFLRHVISFCQILGSSCVACASVSAGITKSAPSTWIALRYSCSTACAAGRCAAAGFLGSDFGFFAPAAPAALDAFLAVDVSPSATASADT